MLAVVLGGCVMQGLAGDSGRPLLPLTARRPPAKKPGLLNKSAVGQVVLCTLAVQNACQMLSMRYSRMPGQPRYLTSTAVVLAEVVKMVCSFAILAFQVHNGAQCILHPTQKMPDERCLRYYSTRDVAHHTSRYATVRCIQ